MANYYYCIDVGGTTIKGGIVDDNNNILFSSLFPAELFLGEILWILCNMSTLTEHWESMDE